MIVIEHDLDVIRSADYIIGMGPGGGKEGGRIVACGTPDQARACVRRASASGEPRPPLTPGYMLTCV